MNRRFLVAALSVVWAVACLVNARKAVERYRRPTPRWMETLTENWHDYASVATICSILSVAGVMYLRRTHAPPGPPAAGEARARPRPVRWKDRDEVRLGIYCRAWFGALQVPLLALRA